MAKTLKCTIDGKLYHAVLDNNPLADKIAAMCPFRLDYVRSGEHEYYAALPLKARAEGCEAVMAGHKNGLYFFEGWNALSLVFRDCDTAPYEIHHVGDFQEDLASVLEKAGRKIHILCEVE